MIKIQIVNVMRKIFRHSILVMTVSAGSLPGAVVFDGFDYDSSASGSSFESANGGTGWNGGWDVAGTNSQSQLLFDKVWANFTSYGFDHFGTGIGPQTSTTTGAESTRLFATAIDTNPSSQATYYFSYLLNGDSVGPGWTNMVLRTSSGSTTGAGTDSILVQFDGTTKQLEAQMPGQTTATRTAVAGQDILVVGRLQFDNAGTDSMAVSWFTVGQDVSVEPTWTSIATGSISSSLDRVTFRMNNSSRVSNFALGETYLSVVPEPSTYALYAGISALGFMVWRRQRR